MKAITIKQPYASLIAHGIKDIDNRTWKTNFRGRILIHSSAKGDRAKYGCLQSEQRQKVLYTPIGSVNFNDLPFGSIIGSVEIVDCVINHPSIWAEQTEGFVTGIKPKLHEFITGEKVTYNWVLANPIIFEKPIENVKGKLSFWDYPGINEVKIECPYCGSIELAIEDYTTVPWHTYLHKCRNCGEYIMESEWERVNEV